MQTRPAHALPSDHGSRFVSRRALAARSRTSRLLRTTALSCALLMPGMAEAKVSPEEARRLGTDLTPLGGEKKGNADGSIPAWDGGYSMPQPAAGKERDPASYKLLSDDKPLYTISSANLAQYKGKLTAGAQALFARFPSSYKMNVYPTRRTARTPNFINAATAKNAVDAELGNQGESLVGAVTGIPFPIPKSGIEVIWNHKLRYRGTSLQRWNAQLAVQANGAFQPYVLREDVLFQYNKPGITPESLNNVALYFLQFTTAPERQVGNVVLVHETLDQVKEPRRAWLYNPGQRRIRRAPNVAYDNPGTGSDGLRTNDQLDAFNGATDRYTWKLLGKREMIVPYNSVKLLDNKLKYAQIAKAGHMNVELPRYELHRVWVVEAELKPGTSHVYKRRSFYVDEDTWTILAVDNYDQRGTLWRVQETHQVQLAWLDRVGPVCGSVYDLQSNRYLLQEMSNEAPLFKDVEFNIDHFSTGSVQRMAER
ncbi:DUF1329 domain-containing protein [Hydrocarboniphaga effusa]|jgi:hypothetical protein|uniref:Outer membrane lipoprotein-sorting protein n=1 Tax=Hydrocarboniphaga effusa AP103 TaxID=1172194 RepID=I8T7X2_9GAMM|nr:DUF1329 domain-containing protein [Hydrocarboniphaga effusa]EIT69853.1 hypothetical protein WQQ_34350 [Hydrocarboniphaga effusa AP103]